MSGQPLDRVALNGQNLFLSGGNIAWVRFARDVGPGFTNLRQFEEIFSEVQANGGNTLRFWLHTNGSSTPGWSGNRVVGPGRGTVDDLQAILDLAWEHEIGLMLTLWSHDMLRQRYGRTVVDRNKALLSDPDLLQTYIDNALVPMVEAVRGHPAIVAWEIFNEPEGISEEHGWPEWDEVPMAHLQRAINRMAGAIKRADPTAQVTNGAASMSTTTDAAASKTDRAAPHGALSPAERTQVREQLSRKYGHAFTSTEAEITYRQLTQAANYNYYTDDRLIAAGGDPDGTLDFYTVHYYTWFGTGLSPFHHAFSRWNLDKPMVVAEFFLPDDTFGVPWDDLYANLYESGYAGALGWQWFDEDRSGLTENWPRILANTRFMFDWARWSVDILPPGTRVMSFTAEPAALEIGGPMTTRLIWNVSDAASVTLNGEPVLTSGHQDVDLSVMYASGGSYTIRLPETQTFELVAVDADGGADTLRVTVEVLEQRQVNRALGRPAMASASEVCCGHEQPAFSVDGDPTTRWSSSEADDHWIYVDLRATYDIERVVLDWASAFGRDYDLQVSYDGETWRTVHTVRDGDGGTDEHVFAQPELGRFVRMQGLRRGTPQGYSLWEMAVFGRLADDQPPLPAVINLGTNYPNPFTGTTTIPYRLSASAEVRLEVVDLQGRRVAVLVDAMEPAGHHAARFDATTLASGIYLYRLHAGGEVKMGRMVLLR
ncbi:MAG: discoidin domain-containing protein [Bacteroidota bacterium]